MKNIFVTSMLLTTETPGRVIGFDNSIIGSLIFQSISTLAILGVFLLIIYLCILAIRTLRIYIKKNQN